MISLVILFLLQFKFQSIKTRKEPYIRITQENSIEFQVQNVYLIYTWLIVYTIPNLVYSKGHVV